MDALSHFLSFTAVVFLCAVGGIVAFRLLTGAIVTRGLVSDASGGVSGAKLQLLMATVTGALFYAARIATNVEAGEFPPVDRELLALLGGSNGFMLGGLAVDKVRNALRSRH